MSTTPGRASPFQAAPAFPLRAFPHISVPADPVLSRPGHTKPCLTCRAVLSIVHLGSQCRACHAVPFPALPFLACNSDPLRALRYSAYPAVLYQPGPFYSDLAMPVAPLPAFRHLACHSMPVQSHPCQGPPILACLDFGLHSLEPSPP